MDNSYEVEVPVKFILNSDLKAEDIIEYIRDHAPMIAEVFIDGKIQRTDIQISGVVKVEDLTEEE